MTAISTSPSPAPRIPVTLLTGFLGAGKTTLLIALLRVKGIVHLQDIATPVVFHGVRHLFDPPLPINDWNSDDRISRIVVIVRDMSRPELMASLDLLRAQMPDKSKIHSFVETNP